MKKCPKCSSQYGDDSKICRTCDAILEQATEEQPPAAAEDAHPPQDNEDATETAPSKGEAWKCPRCGESVPAGFEVCWNCGTGQDGVPDPEFSKEPDRDDAHPGIWQPPELEPAAKQIGRPCPRCGSSKIIPNANILGRIGYSDGRISIVVDGDPDALIFKDRLYDQFTADICGDCGHVELTAAHPEEFYEHYLHSSSGAGE